MISQYHFLVVLALLSSQFVSGLDVRATPSTCGPKIETIAVVKTVTSLITLESVVTVPHSCYTQTITTDAHPLTCPILTTCGPIPECIILSTETITTPPTDPCCPTTPTSIVESPCPTCQTGCAVDTLTIYASPAGDKKRAEPLTVVSTLGPVSFSTSASPSTSTPCTTTLLVAGALTFGPTKTVYATTFVKTEYEDCGGCETLVTRGIEGIGPVVIFTTTVTDPAPTTITEYACSKPWY